MRLVVPILFAMLLAMPIGASVPGAQVWEIADNQSGCEPAAIAGGCVRWSAPLAPTAGEATLANAAGRLFVDTSFSIGAIAAYDADTGALLWTRDDVPMDHDRLATNPDGATVFVYSASRDLTALDAATGETRWQLNGPHDLSAAAAIGAVGDTLLVAYTTLSWENGDYVLRGPSFEARDAATGALLWARENPAAVHAFRAQLAFSPDGALAYMPGSTIEALRVADGSTAWTATPQTGGDWGYARELLVDAERGQLIGLSDGVGGPTSLLFALDATSGSERWSVSGRELGSFALAGGVAVVGNATWDAARGISLDDGTPVWDSWVSSDTRIGGCRFPGAASDGTVAYLKCGTGIFAFEGATGALLWKNGAAGPEITLDAGRGLLFGTGSARLTGNERDVVAIETSPGLLAALG